MIKQFSDLPEQQFIGAARMQEAYWVAKAHKEGVI